MGTRSLTFVYDEDGEKIVNMYRQMDGYPSGHGLELAEFLEPITMVNGIGMTKAVFAKEDDAREWLLDNAEKWGPMLIVKMKDGSYCAGAWCSS